MGNRIEILTLEQIMREYGMSRQLATRLLNNPKCRTLPRGKGEPYRVARSSWERFLQGETK